MHKYRLISKKGEGTFSEVLKAQSIQTGHHVAIKCMKNHFDSVSQVNNLREVQALRRLAGHPNIIKLTEMLYDEPTGRLGLVFELMDMNLYEAIKGRRHYLPEAKTRQYTYEILKALDHMHRNGIFHRDVKPENLLLQDEEIKLADLGSCRGIYSRQPYTEYISTRWYRAPECLLTDGYYNFKMDLFAAGCVWFEIVALFPLFPGQNETDQIQKIHNVLGTPSPEVLSKFKRNASHMDFNFPEKKGTGIERLLPHADEQLVECMKRLLKYDPDERMLARQALKDAYFRDLRDMDRERIVARNEQEMRSSRTSAHSKMGASSSGASAVGAEDVDASPASGTWHADEAKSGGLPSIKPKRKAAASSASAAMEAPNATGTISGDEAPSASDGEIEDIADSRLLPPIDQGKSHKAHESKAKPRIFKGHVSGAASSGQRWVASNAMSASSGAASGQRWAATDASSGSFADAAHATGGALGPKGLDKMHSTWAPNQQPRKYVSPFSHKKRQ